MPINARTLVSLAQSADESARAILAPLPGLWATTPSELEDLIFLNANSSGVDNSPTPISRPVLGNLATQFHKRAGTWTQEVQHNITLLEAGVPIIRFSHQPISFAYLGVLCQFIFQDQVVKTHLMRHNLAACQVHVILDYDVIGENRLRVGHFPDVQREDGFLPLSVSVPRTRYNDLHFTVDRPSDSVIHQWIGMLETAIKQDLAVLHRDRLLGPREAQVVYERFRQVRDEIEEAKNRASNLPDFHAIFLSRLVNLHWAIPTVFLSGRQVVAQMKQHFEWLLSRYPSICRIHEDVLRSLKEKEVLIHQSLFPRSDSFPGWYICKSCNARVSLTLKYGVRFVAFGTCQYCGTSYELELGDATCPDLAPYYDNLIPKVLFDDLLDVIGLGMVGGVGYIGNAEHTIVSGLIASDMGWNVPPECLWSPKGTYYGTSEYRSISILTGHHDPHIKLKAESALRLIYSGKAAGPYYILSQGYEGLLTMWRNHFEQNGKVTEPSEGRNLLGMPADLEADLRQKTKLLDMPSQTPATP